MKKLYIFITAFALSASFLWGQGQQSGTAEMNTWWPAAGTSGPEIRTLRLKWVMQPAPEGLNQQLNMQWYLGDHYIYGNTRIPMADLGEQKALISLVTLVLSADLYVDNQKLSTLSFDMGATPPHGGHWGQAVTYFYRWDQILPQSTPGQAQATFDRVLSLRNLKISTIEFGGLYEAGQAAQAVAYGESARVSRGQPPMDPPVTPVPAPQPAETPARVVQPERTPEPEMVVEETTAPDFRQARVTQATPQESLPETEPVDGDTVEEDLIAKGLEPDAYAEPASVYGFHDAIKQGDQDQIQWFLQDAHEISRADDRGNQPLHLAIKEDDPDLALTLIDLGVPVDGANKRGQQPIHLAARAGEPVLVERLLDAGVPVDALGESGMTPLHYAAEKGNYPVVRILIDRGADLEKEDHFERTPYDIARDFGHKSLAKLLKVKRGGGLDLNDLFKQ